jgi:hypothetical protein
MELCGDTIIYSQLFLLYDCPKGNNPNKIWLHNISIKEQIINGTADLTTHSALQLVTKEVVAGN